MAYQARFLNRPELTGYLVKQHNLCGKSNCHCAQDRIGHEANYIYYRAYTRDLENGNRTGYLSKLKKKYIKKNVVKKWQRKLALNKAYTVVQKLSVDALNDKDLIKLKGNEFLIKAYYKYRMRRDGTPYPVLNTEITEQFRELNNRYQRLMPELRLMKLAIKAQKLLENPYNTRARSIAGTKGWIRRRQRYYANKQFV